MEVVAEAEPVGESFQRRGFFLLRVIEPHLVAFAEVALDRGSLAVIEGIGRHHEGKQIVEASRGIRLGGVGDAAIRLLPRLVEPMRHVAGVVVVADIESL